MKMRAEDQIRPPVDMNLKTGIPTTAFNTGRTGRDSDLALLHDLRERLG